MVAAILGLVLSLASLGQAAQPGTLAPDETLERIQALVRKGDFQAARAALADAIRNYPRDPVAYNFKGVVDAQQGDYREAEASFRKAIELQPGFVPAYENLGRLLQENAANDAKATEKAIAVYERLLATEPESVNGHFQLAVLYQARKRFREALTHLDRLPPEIQKQPQALALRVAVEAGLGDTARSEQLARALAENPDLEEADADLAVPALLESDAHRGAALVLESLVKRKAASAHSLQQLGALYEAEGKLAEARRTYEKSSQSGEITASLLVHLARVAYKQRDFEGALSYLAHARDLEPRNAGVHFFFGMVCVEMDLALDAEKSLQAAVDLSPENPYYNYALGAVMANSRKWKEAIPHFEKYCAGKPDDPRGKLALASVRFHAYEPELSRKEFLELVDKPETAAGARYHLGLMAIRENEFPQAVAELREAARINPDYAEAYAELGFAQMELEDYEEARKSLERAIELSPGSRRAHMVLLSLYQRTDDPRAEAQAKRFAEVDKQQAERAKMLLRTIEARPYQ